jgi:hypothetical protein
MSIGLGPPRSLINLKLKTFTCDVIVRDFHLVDYAYGQSAFEIDWQKRPDLTATNTTLNFDRFTHSKRVAAQCIPLDIPSKCLDNALKAVTRHGSLLSDHGEDDLLDVRPAGYNAVYTPRVSRANVVVEWRLFTVRLSVLKWLRRDFLRLPSNKWPSVFIATLFAYTLPLSTALHLSHLDAVMVSSSQTLLIFSNC